MVTPQTLKWYQTIGTIVVCTVCVTVFMMLTASNPSADDLFRAIGSAGVGYAAARFMPGSGVS